MIPDLQASFACEDVRVEASGSHTIIGVINNIGAPSFPFRILKMCIWTRWCSGKGTFHQITRLMHPDEETVFGSAETNFNLNDTNSYVTNVNIFAGLEFKTEGFYQVEIILDDALKLRYPLRVYTHSS